VSRTQHLINIGIQLSNLAILSLMKVNRYRIAVSQMIMNMFHLMKVNRYRIAVSQIIMNMFHLMKVNRYRIAVSQIILTVNFHQVEHIHDNL
jgi:hypothetical protein